MKWLRKSVWVGLGVALVTPAVAQEEVPPRSLGFETLLIQRSLDADWLGEYAPAETFDPNTDFVREYDVLFLTLIITDPDWEIEEEPEPGAPPFEVEEIFTSVSANWIPVGPSITPSPAPLPFPGRFSQATPFDFEVSEGLPIVRVTQGPFFIPNFIGPTQGNLRDPSLPNMRWELDILIAESEDPEAGETSSEGVVLDVFFHELDQPSNPGPRADAGATRRVVVNSTVTLDASRTFDAYNVGFDPTLPDVFDGDELTYSWEFVSGPAVVNPVQTDPSSPFATVTLNTPSDDDPDNLVPYVFRVTVSDNQFPETTSATVEVLAFTEMPPNEPPNAAITVVTPTPLVGDQVVLSALNSTDPEVGELTYLWQQTDELGNPIGPEDLELLFQPLSDVESATVDWVATRAGTFYFRVLVTDEGGLTDTAFVAVPVLDPNSVLGQQALSARNGTLDLNALQAQETDGDASTAAEPEPLALPLCGGSLLPLMVVPFVLPLMRPRRRG